MCGTACRDSRALPAAPCSPQNPGAHLYPAWFLPGCSCRQWCPGPTCILPPARQKDPGKCHPHMATTAELRLREQTPFELLSASYFGKWSQEKSSSPLVVWEHRFQHMQLSAWSTPTLYHTCSPLYNLFCTCRQGKGWKTTGSSVAGTHAKLPMAPGAPVAEGQDNWCG